MSLKPVVCFYKNDQVIHSLDYILINSEKHQNLENFLNKIQFDFSEKIKIVQVNFDLSASVFILNSYDLKSEADLKSNIKNEDIIFKSNIKKNEFVHKVNAIKTDISNGRYYQVNLTSNFTAVKKCKLDSFEIFKYYFTKFQPHFPAYLPKSNQSEILCYSPELFLQKADSVIKTQPIKGTAQAVEKIENILNNEKENAELSMIVDLLRNDLQSVCDNKVVVTNHRKELNLNYVRHTYSEIEGTTNLKLPEILQAMLPAGSTSGCPKAESLKAINEYELQSRAFYTGCIGWWDQNDFKLNLAIRSFLNTETHLTYYSGCGIVYDSNPDKEWQEFQNKAKHLGLLKIIDAFQVSETINPLLPFHIERTYKAISMINTNVQFHEIEKIYKKISTVNPKKCRLEINPFDLDDINIELTDIKKMPVVLKLQLTKYQLQKSGTGLNNYKTNQRDYWDLDQSENEILGINTDGNITETAKFNIFLKIDNVFYTPSLQSGCLDGCLRRYYIEKKSIEINNQKILLIEKDFKFTELENAEIYLGNSLRGLIKAQLVKE